LLYFRGEKIIKSIINEFYQKISEADVVIISGCSAGGLAAYYWVDYFREILPTTV
jgi:ribulose 1,5-bisphosphate synthetase/thiazole synthase